MKRYGNLFEDVCSFDALCAAAREAMRTKRTKPRVARFWLDLEPEVLQLEAELRDHTYRPRPYRIFVVTDPKQRTICAADFRDRVVHHAVCGVLDPIFERSYILDSYACRNGKGTHAAIRRARSFSRRFRYYLKLDVRRFFDSVDHRALKGLLRRKVKDPDLLRLLDVIIDHPVPWTEPGKGIPIGNLTSQHFANLYLDPVDHLVKDDIGIKGYIRYMDDSVLFADDKRVLWDALGQVERFLGERLDLRVKDGSVVVAPCAEGLPFLGFRVFPGVTRLDRRGWRRFRQGIIRNERAFEEGTMDEDALVRSSASLVGHVMHADTRNLRAGFFSGRPDIGL